MLQFHDLALLLIAMLCGYAVWKVFQRWYFNSNLPPGPTGLPLFGVLPWIKPSLAHVTLSSWADKYGPIFSFYAGDKLFVILSDIKTIRDALVKRPEAFSGRPHMPIQQFTNKNHGLVQSDGPLWKDQRRFALSTLRDLGFGKPILENSIKEEIEVLIDEINKDGGKPRDYQLLLNNAVSNVICQLTFGRRFDYTDSRFQELMEHLGTVISRGGQNIFSSPNYLPRAVFKLPFGNRVKDNIRRLREVEEFCHELIKEHQKSFSPENDSEDFIHAFMQAGLKTEGGGYFYDLQLLQSVISLFGAGTETTSTTLRWSILFMAQNQEIQDKVRAEISNLVGPRNLPDLRDRPKLPYTEAVICETQRVANLVPLSVPHRVETEVEFEGYRIPKDAILVPLLWKVHRDPNIFPEPMRFNPDRFLDAGKKSIQADALVPFSVGKRACLGESLAKMELFLFFTALVQSFKFVLPRGENLTTNYDDERISGVTSSPLNFSVKAVPI